MSTSISTSAPTLTQSLKEHSQDTHDALDELIMRMAPFANQDNYGKFLQAQHDFHRVVQPIYHNHKLAEYFDDLSQLSRFERVKKDMADLNITPAQIGIDAPSFNDAEAIGWFYCAEGSNVGAAILYKEAGKIDLKEDFGASHLAAHPDGRMPHWRSVKEKIDALPLSDEEKKQAQKGADDAFAYFKALIQAIYA